MAYQIARYCSPDAGGTFTGIVYSDTGTLNYSIVVEGRLVRRKDGKYRWFKSAEAAAKALDAWIGPSSERLAKAFNDSGVFKPFTCTAKS